MYFSTIKSIWRLVAKETADVKANVKQQGIKDLVAVSYKIFLELYFSFWFLLVLPSPT